MRMNRVVISAAPTAAASSLSLYYFRCIRIIMPRRPVITTTTTTAATTIYTNNNRSISTTPYLQQAVPAANKKKTAPDTPKASQKKVNKEKKGPSASKLEKSASAESRIESLLIKAIDAPSILPPKPSIEEAERRYQIGRNYVIGSFQTHNEMYHDLAVKIRMKRYALQMLPRETYDLGDVITTTTTATATATIGGGSSGSNGTSVYATWKSNALQLNPIGFGPPDHRHVPMYTPPIEGFDINLYADKEDEDK